MRQTDGICYGKRERWEEFCPNEKFSLLTQFHRNNIDISWLFCAYFIKLKGETHTQCEWASEREPKNVNQKPGMVSDNASSDVLSDAIYYCCYLFVRQAASPIFYPINIYIWYKYIAFVIAHWFSSVPLPPPPPPLPLSLPLCSTCCSLFLHHSFIDSAS